MEYKYSKWKQLLEIFVTGILLPLLAIIIFNLIIFQRVYDMQTFIIGGSFAAVYTLMMCLDLKSKVNIHHKYIERVSLGIPMKIDFARVQKVEYKNFRKQLIIQSGKRKMVFNTNYKNHKKLCKTVVDNITKSKANITIPKGVLEYLK